MYSSITHHEVSCKISYIYDKIEGENLKFNSSWVRNLWDKGYDIVFKKNLEEREKKLFNYFLKFVFSFKFKGYYGLLKWVNWSNGVTYFHVFL